MSLPTALWLDWIQDTITEYEETKTEETLRNVLELYDRALGNFRCRFSITCVRFDYFVNTSTCSLQTSSS